MGVQVDPIGLLAWLALGALAGWLTGRWRSAGYGAVADAGAGMAGALLGAYALLLAGAPAAVGLVVAAGTAVLGAASLVLLLSRLARGRRNRPTDP